MPGFIPGIHDGLDCRNKSGNDRRVDSHSPHKKVGHLFKKRCPTFLIDDA